MSMIGFLHDPFPDNHDGFDYSPKSFQDIQSEHSAEVSSAQNAKNESKMLSLISSIFK